MSSLLESPWAIAGLALKLGSLLGMAGVCGGSYTLHLTRRLKFSRQPGLLGYLLASSLLGLGASLAYFLVQVGTINQAGVAGMFDPDMATLIAQTNSGHVAGLRILAFFGSLIAWLLLRREPADRPTPVIASVLYLLAVVLLSVSFTLAGHVSTLALPARIAIGLHTLAAFLWVGSLYPLLHLSSVTDQAKVKVLMQVFGSTALVIVALLLVSGIFLLTRLVPVWSDLLTTAYGQTLLIKLAGVVCLLALAGLNRLRLVPLLTISNSGSLLRASIRTEISVALCVLMATAWLTTTTGPAN
jgi:putative copper resistance protein D